MNSGGNHNSSQRSLTLKHNGNANAYSKRMTTPIKDLLLHDTLSILKGSKTDTTKIGYHWNLEEILWIILY